jgi:hypothetical protein
MLLLSRGLKLSKYCINHDVESQLFSFLNKEAPTVSELNIIQMSDFLASFCT